MGARLDFSGIRDSKNTHLTVYQIIQQLRNPSVRLEDNSAYKINDTILGRLYAFLVENVPLDSSPAIMEGKQILPVEIIPEFQKCFQGLTRSFLHDRLGEIVLRQSTAQQMSEKYSPKLERGSNLFAPRTIEHEVTLLAQQYRFEDIGEKLRRGAESFQTKADRNRGHAYRFAEEYTRIKEAFLR